MNKKTLIAALALAAASPVLAQEAKIEENGRYTDKVYYSEDKYKVVTNRFWSNWFVSVGGGAQIYFGDHDKQASFGNRLGGALDIAVGKWFTPGIGVRLMYSGLQVKGATQAGIHSTGDYLGADKGWTYKQKFNMWNVHADVMFNLSNLLCGYNEKRIYNCSPYIGIGAASATSKPKNADVTGHVGIFNSFRVSKAIDINLDLRGMLVNDDFDGETGGRGGEGMFTATVGLTYKFKQRGWDKPKTVVRYDNEAINSMRERLNELGAENQRLKKALEEGRDKDARTIVKNMASGSLIVFKIGKSDLSNEARANIGMMAEAIKKGDKNAVYTITGYADAGTGSKAMNEKLSKERAEAVYDCLVNEFGVDKAQLNIDYKGGVDNMFYDDPRLSRAVIMKSK